eukprot:8486153-Alexandrium_andersonii.AAC.1
MRLERHVFATSLRTTIFVSKGIAKVDRITQDEHEKQYLSMNRVSAASETIIKRWGTVQTTILGIWHVRPQSYLSPRPYMFVVADPRRPLPAPATRKQRANSERP